MNLFEHDAEVRAHALDRWADKIEAEGPLTPHVQTWVARLRRLAADERAVGGEAPTTAVAA